MVKVGVQESGSSNDACKLMALKAIDDHVSKERLGELADVGGGSGGLAKRVATKCSQVYLLDYDAQNIPPATLPGNVRPIQADLNSTWPLEDKSVDICCAIEVIEHLENPRHFFREATRITRDSGFIFVSTPNSHSVFSKLTFLVRGQHRGFQEACYPAHIVPLLQCDFYRLAEENGLKLQRFYWSGVDTVPLLHWKVGLGGKQFSHSIGVALLKQ